MSFLIYPNKLRRLSGAIMRALSGGGVGSETRHALSRTRFREDEAVRWWQVIQDAGN